MFASQSLCSSSYPHSNPACGQLHLPPLQAHQGHGKAPPLVNHLCDCWCGLCCTHCTGRLSTCRICSFFTSCSGLSAFKTEQKSINRMLAQVLFSLGGVWRPLWITWSSMQVRGPLLSVWGPRGRSPSGGLGLTSVQQGSLLRWYRHDQE